MRELPASAAWRHTDARDGFEVVFPQFEPGGYILEGHATAVEEGELWSVRYALTLDGSWLTHSAHVVSRSAAGEREVRLESDGAGDWRVDGEPAPHLDGLLDVDLEASVVTNTIPVHRLALASGEVAGAPAVYVRAADLAVERLEQRYKRLPDDGPRHRYDYQSPRFEYRAVLTYDEHGLVLDYPGLALRAA